MSAHPPGSGASAAITTTPAQMRKQQLEIAILKLDTWEQNEIDFCSKELRKLLSKWQSSAALAITRMMLEIAIKEGQ